MAHQIWSLDEHPKNFGVLVWSWPSVTSQISPTLSNTARVPPWSSPSPTGIKIHFAPSKICTGGHDRIQWDEGMALPSASLPWSSCQGTAPAASLMNQPKYTAPIQRSTPGRCSAPKNKGEEQRGERGKGWEAKFETCIVLHAGVGLLEGVCHRGALSWEEKRKEKEDRIRQRKAGMHGQLPWERAPGQALPWRGRAAPCLNSLLPAVTPREHTVGSSRVFLGKGASPEHPT